MKRAVILLAAVAIAIPVVAQDTPKPGKTSDNPILKKFDKNGDGKIDDDEKRAVREKLRQMQSKPGATTPSGNTETIGNRDIKEMEFVSSDGRKIPCVLSMSRGDGPFPVLVTIHGGQGNRDFGYIRTMAAPNKLSPTISAFNEQPWAIFAISYRSGGGALFGMEQDDVVAGIRFAKSLPKVDSARVGVVGGSHGGHLALVAAERMGKEFLCVAACSPWMTDPVVYMTGKPDEPPLSLVRAEARDDLLKNGRVLFNNLMRGRGLSEQQAKEFIAKHSIEANAGKIAVPTLFITSRGDDQAPHVMIEPMIRRMKAAGQDVTVYTAEKSPHGFYWARTVSAARSLRGEKTPQESEEELTARRTIIDFFAKQFARKDARTDRSSESIAKGADGSGTPEKPTQPGRGTNQKDRQGENQPPVKEPAKENSGKSANQQPGGSLKPVAARTTSIHIAGGDLVGEQSGEVRVFRGVRYAAPPVGQHRWQPAPSPEPPVEDSDQGRTISAAMLEYWHAFMRDGQPKGKDLPSWPTYSPSAPRTMVFGNQGISAK